MPCTTAVTPPLTAPAELRYAACQSSVSEALMFVTFRVGRADDADVVLEDTRVSRRQEEAALNNPGQYCLDNLINRLYEN